MNGVDEDGDDNEDDAVADDDNDDESNEILLFSTINGTRDVSDRVGAMVTT